MAEDTRPAKGAKPDATEAAIKSWLGGRTEAARTETATTITVVSFPDYQKERFQRV